MEWLRRASRRLRRPLVLTADAAAVPDHLQSRVPAQVVDVPTVRDPERIVLISTGIAVPGGHYAPPGAALIAVETTIVTVPESQNPVEIAWAKAALEEAGIDFYVAGEDIGVLAEAISPFIMPLCRVQVASDRKVERGRFWSF